MGELIKIYFDYLSGFTFYICLLKFYIKNIELILFSVEFRYSEYNNGGIRNPIDIKIIILNNLLGFQRSNIEKRYWYKFIK